MGNGKGHPGQMICAPPGAAKRNALRMGPKGPTRVPREDLIAASMIGLIEAADRYDTTRAEPFITFAEHRIRGAVLDELRRGDIMPRRVRALARRIAAVIRKLEHTGGSATDQQIASEL